MSQFTLSPLAAQDLNDIFDYIAQDDIEAADRVVNELYEAILLISSRPYIGHERSDLTDEPLRFWPVRRYLVIYSPDTNPLEIVRVLIAYRDVRKVLSF
jgi:antitoxin ParD1/3/4/toxin ParE1/3/4